MKSPSLLFVIKVVVIVYFVTFTGINNYTTGQAASPIVTRGAWKIKFFTGAHIDPTRDYTGYSFVFNPNGTLEASKDDITVRGKWFEDEVSQKINIQFSNSVPELTRLNSHWKIRRISNGAIELQNNNETLKETSNIAGL